MRAGDPQAVPVTDRGLRLRIIQLGIVVIMLCALTTVVFVTFLGQQTRMERIVLLTLWVVLLGMWALSSFMAWLTRNKQKYYFLPDSVYIVKSGMAGSQEDMYRYDSVLSVRVKQTLYGKRHNYGDILLRIPRLENQVVLRDVVDPGAQATILKRHIGRRSTGAGSLVN